MTTPTTTPIGLTDEQMNTVYSRGGTIGASRRSAFLEALASALRGRGEIGDGELHQAIRETQREYVTNLRVHASWHQ